MKTNLIEHIESGQIKTESLLQSSQLHRSSIGDEFDSIELRQFLAHLHPHWMLPLSSLCSVTENILNILISLVLFKNDLLDVIGQLVRFGNSPLPRQFDRLVEEMFGRGTEVCQSIAQSSCTNTQIRFQRVESKKNMAYRCN